MRAAHLLLPVALVACSTKSQPEARQHPQPGAALSGTMPLHMRNCPSAVASARTTSTPTATGVDLDITTKDPVARRQLVELARVQRDLRDPVWLAPPHSGMHGGPGTIGHCPIVHAGTTVTYELIPDGVRIHVTARSPREVASLQQATDQRVRSLTMPAS